MDEAEHIKRTSGWLPGEEPSPAPGDERRAETAGGQAAREPRTVHRMPWAWHIGRFAGIDVYIHATFLILIAWLLWLYLRAGSSLFEAIAGILFVMAVFACVVLHEYGHALTARHFGIATPDITLLPIGGIARLERIPTVPAQELYVAIAGPLVNVGIALVLFVALGLTGSSFDTGYNPVTGLGTHPLVELMDVNIMLVLFNLLPAFPMDGGRVLRALLAMKMPRIKATRIASRVGQGMAVLFGVAGFMGQPFLLFIALFVFLGASHEYQSLRWEAAVEGLRVRDAMQTAFCSLRAADPLSHAVALSLQGSQHDFPVLDDSYRVCGLLLRQDLIGALHAHGGEQPVSSAMRRVPASAVPEDSLLMAFERMQTARLPVLPVFAPSGELQGLLTTDNVAEMVMLRNALAK